MAFTKIGIEVEAYARPYTPTQIKTKYPMLAKYLLADKIHNYRATTGIELIHKEPNRLEQQRIWDNWQRMPKNKQVRSDNKSLEHFGITNAEHNTKLGTYN